MESFVKDRAKSIARQCKITSKHVTYHEIQKWAKQSNMILKRILSQIGKEGEIELSEEDVERMQQLLSHQVLFGKDDHVDVFGRRTSWMDIKSVGCEEG